MIRLTAALLITLCCSLTAYSQDSDSPGALSPPLVEQAMTLERMAEILNALDPEMQSQESRFLLNIEGVQVFVITDVTQDRMRVMTPVRQLQGISPDEMTRMMQANFDTALDARYAIGRETLWAVYVHPLSPLQKNQLISGVGQVINLALTYGSIYSGGALNYGGGDSGGINRKLIEDLLEKGEAV